MKLILVLFIVAVIGLGVAEAQQPGVVTWWTVDGGGGKATSPTYQLEATVGQPDAGASSSTIYKAEWGFWKSNPMHTIDDLEDGALAMERDVTYGDVFKAFAFLIVSVAAAAKWVVSRWYSA